MEVLLTVPEVATRVGFTRNALYRMCRERRFPHIRVGKLIRIPESGVQRWLEEQLRQSTTGPKKQ